MKVILTAYKKGRLEERGGGGAGETALRKKLNLIMFSCFGPTFPGPSSAAGHFLSVLFLIQFFFKDNCFS